MPQLRKPKKKKSIGHLGVTCSPPLAMERYPHLTELGVTSYLHGPWGWFGHPQEAKWVWLKPPLNLLGVARGAKWRSANLPPNLLLGYIVNF
jgi:hypothetical protein